MLTIGFRRKKVSKGARIRIPTPLAVPPARAVRPRLEITYTCEGQVRGRRAVGEGRAQKKGEEKG